MSRSLDQIAQKHRTDKSSLLNALTEKYEMYLEPRRTERLVLLEIGIYQGASIRKLSSARKAKILGHAGS